MLRFSPQVSTTSMLEGGAVLLREMRKNIPFPRRSVPPLPGQKEKDGAMRD